MNRLRMSILAVLTCAAGCGPDAGPVDEQARAVSPDGALRALESAEMGIAQKAAAILSEELDIPISEIEIDSVRAVDWRDSSIGCPQPGQAYAQVITPGHKIVLRARGRIHVMHEAGGKPFLCKRTKAVTELTPQRELVWAEKAMEAREHLAARLNVDPGLVIVANASRNRWPDASLGCPEPDAQYAASPVDGYVITLRHGSRNYTYHTDLDRVIPCPAISAD